MYTSSLLFLFRLMFTLVMTLCLISCGGDEVRTDEEDLIIVETNIPGMYFEIPKDALPKGLEPTDIEITPIQLPIDETSKENGVEMQAWKLTPEGTQFEKPIRLIMPFEQSVPAIFHQYNDEVEWVSGVEYKMAVAGNTASVPLSHFSVVVSVSPVRSIFNISGGAANTLIDEPIDVQLVFAMNSDYYDIPFGEPGTESYWIARNNLLPQDREACPERFSGCSIFTSSENIDYGELQLEPASRIFDDRFTLHSDDFVCEDPGTGVLEIKVPIQFSTEWWSCEAGQCEEPETSPNLREADFAMFYVEIPVNCVAQKMDIAVLGFEQKASTDVVSTEAATNSMHQSGEVEEYSWDMIDGDGVLVTTSTEDYVETSYSSQSKPYHNIALLQKASVPSGVTALAAITTQTQVGAFNFFVEGEINLDTDGMDDMEPKQWAVSGRATAEWNMSVSIKEPSVVTINNCELFDQLSFTSFPDFQKEADICSFKVDGTSNFKMPSMPGLPDISIDQNSIQIDDENKEAKRLSGLLGGQVVTFVLSAEHSEDVSFSPSSSKSFRNESFSVSIQQSKEE